MAIPESQLETWSHQGSITQSSSTYNTIKNVLDGADTPYKDKDYSIFLQGSYGNDTNIYAESDVDVVIQLNDCWKSDLTALSEGEKVAYKNAHDSTTYGYSAFKQDVLKVLTDQYGNDVKGGDKAIAIKANGSRRKADVISAIQFRRYYKFNGTYDQSYDQGICFFDSSGTMISNYPRQHSENLTKKHQGADQWLKPMTRVLKNLRGKLVADGTLAAGIAPSYYLEGLLYNVPDDKFKDSHEDCFVNAMNWLKKDADTTKLVCANEQYYLLRDNVPTCWPIVNGEMFINAAIKLWKDL